ncbi:hypothetical protein ACFV2X_48035 [Streptomyces sp. NPDC059679]|uniref:hypothetical protein n=1 Tax=Streptomyces sp. NPDC059679 TaxID=3346903 RepID=UPI00368C45C7
MNELPRLQVEGGHWYRAVPPPAVPVPAVHMPPDLHGQRAIVSGQAGILHDLRVMGDAQHSPDGTTWLNVVPELDYWRAKIAPGSIASPQRVPIADVWIEHRLPYEPTHGDKATSSTPAGAPDTLLRRLAPQPNHPGARTPVPARTVPHLHGRRIIQATPLGFAWDLRAVSEPYEADHEITLNLLSANDYYRWLITGDAPEVTPSALYLLWTE